VSTSKPGKLYLHIFERPENGVIVVPGMKAAITGVYQLDNKQPLRWWTKNGTLVIRVPALTDKRNTVLVVAFKGGFGKQELSGPTISSQYALNTVNVVSGKVSGGATVSTVTFSHYFGDWKHVSCAGNMMSPDDAIEFRLNITDPGDYRMLLEYACPQENSRQEGIVQIGDKEYRFETLRTSACATNEPLLFIRHPVAIISIGKPGTCIVKIHPLKKGKELFKLQSMLLEPVR
jgi:alpha-L-fucosidase